MTEEFKTASTPANQAPQGIADEWLAMPFRDWCPRVGISVSHAYDLVAEGKLKITKAGNKSLMTRAESDRFLHQGA